MSEEQNPGLPEEPALPEGPGTRLRQAREQRQLSVEQVGRQLNLEPRQVRALEANDWPRLPEPIYVAGYLRNYARLLELPEVEILAAYPQRQRETPVPAPAAPRPRDTEPSRMVAAVGAVLVIAALVLALLWFLGRFEGEGTVPPMPDTPNEAPAELPGETPAEEGPAPEPPAPEAVNPAPAQSTPATAPQAPAAAETADRTGAGADAASDSSRLAPAPPRTPAGEARLSLRYTADSWTEVTDATGGKLAYGLIRAGATLDLRGQAPFTVFLGYAPGVGIEYNGTSVDPAPYTRNNIARFKLGREARPPSQAAR